MLHELNDEMATALRNELRAGESLLWCTQPLSGRVAAKRCLVWFFAVPWTAFSLTFLRLVAGLLLGEFPVNAGSTPTPWWVGVIALLFILPFVGVGLLMMALPLLSYWESSTRVYALTTQRLLMLTRKPKYVVRSLRADEIGPLTRSQWRDGSGTLKIYIGAVRDVDKDHRVEQFVIEDIREVSKAEQLIADFALRRDHPA